MLAKMKKMLQTNRALQRQARELRSAHSRVEKLERQVAHMQQELRTSAQTGGSDSQALEEEHAELSKLVSDSQTAASAALQEMAAVELRVMRSIRGECEEANDENNVDKVDDANMEGVTESARWGTGGAAGSRRPRDNDCVASVSSFSEGVLSPLASLSHALTAPPASLPPSFPPALPLSLPPSVPPSPPSLSHTYSYYEFRHPGRCAVQ